MQKYEIFIYNTILIFEYFEVFIDYLSSSYLILVMIP